MSISASFLLIFPSLVPVLGRAWVRLKFDVLYVDCSVFFTSLSTFSLHCCCCWLVGGGGAGAAVATEYRYGVLVFFSLPLYYYYISWKMREPKIGIYVFLMLSQLRCSAVEVTATGRMKSAIDTKFFRCGMCSKSIKPTVCGPHTGERGHTISGRSSLTLFSPVRATSFSPSSSCRSNGVATASAGSRNRPFFFWTLINNF